MIKWFSIAGKLLLAAVLLLGAAEAVWGLPPGALEQRILYLLPAVDQEEQHYG